jgi:hypothetical protein
MPAAVGFDALSLTRAIARRILNDRRRELLGWQVAIEQRHGRHDRAGVRWRQHVCRWHIERARGDGHDAFLWWHGHRHNRRGR